MGEGCPRKSSNLSCSPQAVDSAMAGIVSPQFLNRLHYGEFVDCRIGTAGEATRYEFVVYVIIVS